MPTTDPVIIPIEGDTKDFTADAAKVNASLDSMASHTKAAGSNAGSAAKVGSMAWTEFNSVLSVASQIARVGGQIWNETAGKFVEYASQVREVSRSLGASTEESSRLIQVADDVTLSYSSLTIALKMAQKDGIDPSIDGLAKLSDQYLQLKPGVERTQFLLDKFGKSGGEMGKLMEKGGASIRKMSDAMDANMILTQKSVDAAREYEIGVDALSDAWDGFTYQVAPPLIKAATSVMTTLRDWTGTAKILGEQQIDLKDMTLQNVAAAFGAAVADREAADAAAALAQSNMDAAGTFDSVASGMSAEEEAAKSLADELKAVSDRNQEMLSFTMSYADFMDGYTESHKEALEKVTEAQQKLNETIEESGLGSDEAIAAADGLREAQTALGELEASWHEKTQRMIYDMILTKLSVDGLTDAEYKAALEVGVTMGILSQAEAQQAQSMMDVANATVAGIQAQEALRMSVNGTTSAYAMQAQVAYAASKVPGAPTGPIGSENKAPNRDSGGVGIAGQEYLIGRGAQPETFTPTTNGVFTPNADKSKSGDTYNVVINNPVPEKSENSMRSFLKSYSYAGAV